MTWLLAAWRFVAGSRVAKIVLAVLGVFMLGRYIGGKGAREKAREADRQRADDVRSRVDDAIRRNEGDARPADERLRERGKLRD